MPQILAFISLHLLQLSKAMYVVVVSIYMLARLSAQTVHLVVLSVWAPGESLPISSLISQGVASHFVTNLQAQYKCQGNLSLLQSAL